MSAALTFCWCPGGDSNSHAIRRYHLKIVCLPIPPPGHSCSYRAKRRAWQAFFFIPANFCILPPVVGPLSAAPSPLRSFPKAGLSPQPASSARPVTGGEDRCARRTVAPPSTHPPPPEALGRASMRSGRLRQRKGTPRLTADRLTALDAPAIVFFAQHVREPDGGHAANPARSERKQR